MGWGGRWPATGPVPILKRAAKGAITDIATSGLIFKFFTYRIFRYAHLHDIGPIDYSM